MLYLSLSETQSIQLCNETYNEFGDMGFVYYTE